MTAVFFYLYPDGEIVFLDALVVQGMVDFDVGPGLSIVRTLLEVKGVVLVGLGRGASYNAIEYHRIFFNARARLPGEKCLWNKIARLHQSGLL